MSEFTLSKEFQTHVRSLLNEPAGVSVTFEKKDGSERTMFCTLSESKIPENKRPKVKEEAETSIAESAIRVFDLEKQEWRSFRWDSIRTVSM